MTTINKTLLLNIMPFVAVAIWIAGMFLPFPVGDLAIVGFAFGLALRAALPYYMAWKQNEEILVFNLAYLMPIVVLIAGAVIGGITGVSTYLNVVFTTDVPQLVYIGATVFAYGGYDAFNGFRKWWPFLEELFKNKQLDLELALEALADEYEDEEENEEEEVSIEKPIDEIPVPEPTPPVEEGPV